MNDMVAGVKLYELTDEFVSAMQQLQEAGFDEQTIADTMEGLQGTLEAKVHNVVAYIENLQAEVEARKAHAEKVMEKAKSLQKQADGLREYLRIELARIGKKEMHANGVTLKIRNNPPSVKVAEDAKLPEIFLREIPARYEPDKTAIKEALKAGKEIPGCELVSTQKLVIE